MVVGTDGLSGRRIGEELGPLDCASSRGLDSLSHLDRGFTLASQGLMKPGIRPESKLTLEFSDGGNAFSEIHAPILNPDWVYATPNDAIPRKGPNAHHGGMAKSPLLQLLQEDEKAYRSRAECSQTEISDRIGITLATYRNRLYGSKPLTDKFLKDMAKILGFPQTRYVDDPNREIAGQSRPDLTPRRRMLAVMLVVSFSDDQLSDEDAGLLFREFERSKDLVLSMRNKQQIS